MQAPGVRGQKGKGNVATGRGRRWDFQWRPKWGMLPVYMGDQILINATSADKPRFLECRNVTATMRAPVPVPLPSREVCGCVLVRPRASCDSEDWMRCEGIYVHWLIGFSAHEMLLVCVCVCVCLSVSADAPRCLGDKSGFVEAGVASLAFASYRQCTPIPSRCIAYLALRQIPPLLPTTPNSRCFGSWLCHRCWRKESEAVQLWPIIVKAIILRCRPLGRLGSAICIWSACPWLMG